MIDEGEKTMSQALLKKYFNIIPEKSFFDGKQVRYQLKDRLYTLVPVTNVDENVLVELYEMSNHLMTTGDRYVSTFYPAKDEKFLVTDHDIDYVLLENRYLKEVGYQHLGRKLAKMHVRGRSIPVNIQHTNRMGQWKTFWEQRLQQMERVWYQTVEEHPDSPFEQLFVEAFPYYIGLCENAIQYVVDTELDDTPTDEDAGTICHERFHRGVWGKRYMIHQPFDWVFDHASRDIAEKIREEYVRKQRTFIPEIQTFLQEYQSISPLSSFSWRFIYARLLFPLHFFQCVEEYFLSHSERDQKYFEDQLQKIIRDAKQYENFLGDFYELARVPVRREKIPLVGWLK